MNIPGRAKKAGADALGDYVERCNEWDTEDAANITLWDAARLIAAQALREHADALGEAAKRARQNEFAGLCEAEILTRTRADELDPQ